MGDDEALFFCYHKAPRRVCNLVSVGKYQVDFGLGAQAMSWLKWRTILFIVVVLAVATHAQSPYATLIGTVRDTTGARVPAARITAQQQGTNASRQAQSNSVGEFALASLPPGEYRITVVASNFREE